MNELFVTFVIKIWLKPSFCCCLNPSAKADGNWYGCLDWQL